MKIGADDYLSKPFGPDEFINVVRHAIRKNKEESTIKKEEYIDHESDQDRKEIEKEDVLAVLNRTNNDKNFWKALWKLGSNALKGYSLSSEAKAAIALGDVNWIKENYKWEKGELTEDKLSSIKHFLEIERW